MGEAGTQRGSVAYTDGIGCCVVAGGAFVELTTRLGAGRLDFRGNGLDYAYGIGCCVGMGGAVF